MTDVAAPPARRLWSFGPCAFDEARWALSLDGKVVEIEAKPLEILLELLRHAGEVVTKDELMDAVWPGVVVVEGSLTTAISKLRKALGPKGEAVVVTVPRIGYRLGVAAVSRPVESAAAQALPFEPGMTVPERPNWRFVERLNLSVHSEVWTVRHAKTGVLHVIKYARDAARLRVLKREVAVSRLLRGALGDRPDFVAVLDWNFAAAPFFLESAHGGADLARWAVEAGGLAGLPLAERLAMAASIAATVGAAHGLGILHKDLKPANILVAETADGGRQIKVVDFGSAALSDPDRLDALDITYSGFEHREGAPSSGTPLWMAPELLAGGAAGVASDVYALGVILYQLVVGDLRRPLAPGWEADVADPLLREDIGLAAAGDPARRLDSAADLARRLRSLDDRRAQHEARVEAAAQALLTEQRLERSRARGPWIAAAGVLLAIGAISTSLLYVSAARARDEARHQAAVSDKISKFLASDLLARSSPFRAGSPDESLVGAVKQASPLIDIRFAGEPAVAARLHQTIANALDKKSDWPGARGEYARAADLWTKAQGPGSPDALVARLQLAMMLARSAGPGSLDEANRLIAGLQGPAGALAATRPDVKVWLASARGMAALIGNDISAAQAQFTLAADGADAIADFDAAAKLTFRQRVAFTHIRSGDGAGAEALFRKLQAGFQALEGADGPNTLMVGMNLAQALMIEGRHADAVAQADSVYPRLLARLGPDHEMTLQLLTTRAQSEGVLERWDASIADDLKVHEIAVRKQGPASFFAIATQSDAATAQCRGGHAPEGLANARAALGAARAGMGKSALTDAVAYTVAACEIALGRYAQAAADLQGIDRSAVAQLAGDPNWGANVDLALAQIAAAQGRAGEARRLVTLTAAAFAAKGAEPYQVRAWKRLDATVPKA